MSDENDKLASSTKNLLVKKVRFGASALHERVAKKQEVQTKREALSHQQVVALPNRIGIMLDCSGSMAGEKIQMARLAAEAFLSNCNPSDTGVAINTFEPTFRINMTNIYSYAQSEVRMMNITGGTPMAEAMLDMIQSDPITRAVLVSDGEATGADPLDVARTYAEAKIPIDCVHIGDSDQGEETLKKIAKMTGGIYVKFEKVDNFAQNFKYLTPRYRAMLNSAGAAQLIGATEVI